MRDTFIRTLTDLAAEDERILLLTADLGYTVLEKFADRNPKQFFNVGVAEQNMLGLATGLAESGFVPFVYSIATFATLRTYEFIRNGPVLHHLPVRIVGVGGGFEYGSAGPTHHALEDVGALRMQPGLEIVAPADFQQAGNALKATWNRPGPVYYRLGKNEKATVPGLNGVFRTGRIEIVREGSDLVILSMGGISAEASLAANLLEQDGISACVVVVASVSPPPADDLVALLERFPLAVTVEAHYRTGGLGSLVSEVIADNGLQCRVKRCGVQDHSNGISGTEGYLNSLHGISGIAVAETVRGIMAEAE